MRLALKLLLSLAATTLVLLGLTILIEHRRQDELLSMDIEAEARLSKTLRAVVMRVCDLNGPSAAREVVETVNKNAPRDIRWLEPDQVPRMPGRDLPAEVASHMASGEPIWVHWPDEKTGEPVRYVYIPVTHDGKPLAVIEASQSMAPRHAWVVRAHVQTAAVGLLVVALSGALAAVLGRRLVGKPVAAIMQSVRTLGDGEFVPPAIGNRSDELGSLAVELEALGEKLAARERMRHDDRLRTVGQLASGVAHELGTPLSVVGVRARLIASGEATGDEVVTNAKAIMEQSERMTRLVRQLLDYSRRGGATATSVDLRQIMLRTVEMLEPLARTRNVSIVAESEEGDVQVNGDPAQLQQVLTNLVLNGIQAMPTGGKLAVHCGRESTRRGSRWVDQCILRVTDEGPGIAPADLEHVFEPFFTTKPAGRGSGLGLIVAKGIVSDHGGTITVSSRPGEGTEFKLVLPACDSQSEASSKSGA